jgi:hypothetical protein
MKVTMLLADYAQVADGKLNLIGGGWTMTGPNPAPFALALLFEVPWDRANERHLFTLELLDADGRQVAAPGPEGPQPVALEAAFEVGRPVGMRPGTPITAPFALNLGPQPLQPGERYEWRLTVDGETREDWRVGFEMRPA